MKSGEGSSGTSSFKMLTGKLRGKRPLKRPSLRWEDNITINLTEIGIIMRRWVDSAQDRGYWGALVNAALNLGKSISHGAN